MAGRRVWFAGAFAAAAVTFGGSSMAAAQDARCEPVRTALEHQRSTRDETNDAVTERQLELRILDAAAERLKSGSLARGAFAQMAQDTAGQSQALPAAMRRWLAAIPAADAQITPAMIAAQRQAAQKALDDLTKQKADADRQITELQRQEDLFCRNNPTTRGPADTSAGGNSVDNPPPAGGSSTDWSGSWTHDFGKMSFDPQNTDQIPFVVDERLKDDNPWGLKVACDRVAVYRGEAEWDRAGGGLAANYRGKVFACTNGSALEGKISNYGEGSQVFSTSFRISIVDADENKFGGTYRVFVPSTRATSNGPAWSGTGPQTAEIELRGVPPGEAPATQPTRRYQPTKATAAVPAANLRPEGAPQIAVRAGDRIVLHNVDSVFWKPFSRSRENAFEAEGRGVAPGTTMRIIAKNPTHDPVVLALFDDLQGMAKMEIYVLPVEAERGTPPTLK